MKNFREISKMLPQRILLVATLLVSGICMPAQTNSGMVDLNITFGKSLVIDYPADIGRISTSDPAVVDAVPATPREFLLHAKGQGVATIVVWAKTGQRTLYNVTVEHNVEPIRKLLAETFPGEDIRVQSGRDSITLVGKVTAKDVAERAVAIATPLAKTVVSNLGIAPATVARQVVLRVKFAELNRNISDAFGVNIFSLGATGTVANLTTGQFPSTNIDRIASTLRPDPEAFGSRVNITDALNMFAFRPDLNLGGFLRALESEGILQILAQPNIVTTDGQAASFLVGGEFPVPVLQGGQSAGAVTVMFREYGIRLNFTPTLTPNSTVKMFVKPEVSTIDLANAITVSGFTIPALATRRMETNVELALGQSFLIAGLVDDRTNETFSRIPGISNIPVLGQLFKSRNERRSRTELVVLVTPEIVELKKVNETEQLPAFPRKFIQQLDRNKMNYPAPSSVEDMPSIRKGPNDPGFGPVVPKQAAPKPTTPTSSNNSSPVKKLQFWKRDKTAASAAGKSAPVAQPQSNANPPVANGSGSAPSGSTSTTAIPADKTAAPAVNGWQSGSDPQPVAAPAAPAATSAQPAPKPLQPSSPRTTQAGLSAIPELGFARAGGAQ
jgi:pilus assembly protein CpaC